MSARKQSQHTLFTFLGKYVIALSLLGSGSLQAQTNYYLDYSHNVVVGSPGVGAAGADFQTDMTAVAYSQSTKPDSVHFELDMDNFTLVSHRSSILLTEMHLSNESHFRYPTSEPRDEVHTQLDTANTPFGLVNTFMEQPSSIFIIDVDSFNSSSLSTTDGATNALHDQLYNDPIRSPYCIQRKYTFTQPTDVITEDLNQLHQEQLSSILSDTIVVDSEFLFPIAIENDFTMTPVSGSPSVDIVWVQTFWFSSEAAMNHTQTSLQSVDQAAGSNLYFPAFLTSSYPLAVTNLTVAETIGSPVAESSPEAIVYNNGQVDLLLSGGANESHLLTWSEDLSTWSGSDINLSVDNGSINTPIDQSLHVVPSTDGATISLTFPTTVPDKAFFQLEQSTLLRP